MAKKKVAKKASKPKAEEKPLAQTPEQIQKAWLAISDFVETEANWESGFRAGICTALQWVFAGNFDLVEQAENPPSLKTYLGDEEEEDEEED